MNTQKQENSELKLVNEKLKKMDSKHKQEINDLNHNIATMQSTLHETTSQLLAMKRIYHEGEQEKLVQDLDKMKMQLRQQIELAAKKREEQIAHHSNELATLNKRLVDKESAHQDDRTKVIDEYSNKMVQKEQEFNKKHLELTEEYEKNLIQLQKYQQALKEANAVVEQMQMQQKDNHHQHAKQHDRIDELSQTITENKHRMNDLIISKQDQNRKLHEVIKKLEIQLANYKKLCDDKLPKLEADNQVLTLDQKSKGDVIVRLENRIKELEAQLTSKDSQNKFNADSIQSQYAEKIVSLEKQFKEQQDVVRIKDTIIEDKDDTIKKLKQALQKWETDTADYKRRAHDIHDKLEDEMQYREQLEKELRDKQNEVEEYEEYVSKARQAKKEFKASEQALKSQVQEQEENIASLQQQLKESQYQISKLDGIFKQETEKLETKCKTMEADHATKLKDLEQVVQRQVMEIQHLNETRQQLLNAQQELLLTRQTILTKENELKVALRALEKQTQARKDSEQKLRKLSSVFKEVTV